MASWGEVVFVSRNQGIAVVRSEDGFTVVELLGDEGFVQVGDRAIGDWSAGGGETIRVRGQALDAYFQATCGTFGQAVSMARRMGGG
ncbi:MAG: hypothetical protein PGN33_01685 [Methylobacterium radiotolerans]